MFLVYPVINTLLISLKDAQGEGFVGLDNFKFVFTDESMLRAIRNTLGWTLVVPVVAVSIGLAFATLVDRLRRGEAVAKSLIFMPMAISFAGAAITWRLIYDFRPEGFGSNIGLANGIWMGLGHQPVAWLQQDPWNNLLLMVIMVWMQTGFAMVVLSAAIKAIPEEITEAARIDGASEFQVFRRILVPSIAPTIAVVATYMVINALKVFDIVFVMGSAETNKTEVIAERMIDWFFISNNRRARCGDRRGPVRRHHPDHALEHEALPGAGADPMSAPTIPAPEITQAPSRPGAIVPGAPAATGAVDGSSGSSS